MLAVSIFLTACQSTNQRLDAAGGAIGKAAAGVTIDPWPAYCQIITPHAQAAVGDEVISILKRERGQLDAANKRTVDCTEYYEAYRKGLAG